MLGWLKLLRKKFNKLNSVVQIAIGLLIVVAVRYLIQLLQYRYYSASLENFSNPKKLVYFHMNTCGHCKKFNPEWDKFAASYNGPIEIKKVERKEAGDDLEKYKIQGFPSILLIDEQDNTKEFDGDRTVTGLEKFVSSY
uniref:Thioredoxin domain-containing protein n=1 Tax=viral metagenome TaxID=1070528 RepID=A0A6C0KER5_9ZZZZ